MPTFSKFDYKKLFNKEDKKKLQIDREQFDKYREVEEGKLAHEKEKLEIDKQQFAKDKELTLQKLDNDKKELDVEKKYKSKNSN